MWSDAKGNLPDYASPTLRSDAWRFGEVGGEETFYNSDPTDPAIDFQFRPTRDGELFVFVNDAVIGIPGLYRAFYRNNTGTARLAIERVKTR